MSGAGEPIDRLLGERLLSSGRMSSEELTELIEAQRASGGRPLGELLLERGCCTGAELYRWVAEIATGSGRLDDSGGRLTTHLGTGAATPGARSPSPARPASGRVSSGSIAQGRRLGRYVLLDVLGRGGMGVVFKAHDTALRRSVAIKMIGEGGGELSEQQVKRFEREAIAAARLRHPGIVAVHEVGAEDGRPYLVMDLVEGESLERRLAREETSPRWAAEVVVGMARALQHAHEHGVIHRDVKPENVLIDGTGGEPRLTDFGLAREVASDDALTVSGQMVGTPVYMAPEQAGAAGGAIGPATDVYGLGGVLYRALVGRPPFGAPTMMELMQKVLFAEPEPPRRIRPNVHPDLETIALRCLAKEPARRYPSARALADDLERFLKGELIQARPVGRAERVGRWARRNRLLAALAAGLVLVVLGATAVGVGLLVEMRRRVAAERAEVARGAGEAARAAWAHFERVRERRADDLDEGVPTEQRRAAIDELLASGLEAMQAAATWRALAPADADAGARAFAATMAYGEVAIEAGQWSVAGSAFEKARALDVDAERVSEALGRVGAERERVAREHRAAVQRVIDQAKAGELISRPGAYEDALFTLVRYSETQTVALLAAELDRLTDAMRRAEHDALLDAATPTEDERRAGIEPLPGIREDLARWLERGPDSEPDPALARAIGAAARRLMDRAAATRATGARTAPGFRELLASAQGRGIGPDGVVLARLCCEALGRIGIREVALEALLRYLHAEEDELRAVHAGVALCLLGGERAERQVVEAARLFGRSGPYWRRTERYLTRTGADTKVVAETPTAYQERARVRREKGDREGARADLERALELDPRFAPALADRALLRLDDGDLAGAREDIEAALAIAPRAALVWSSRAKIRAAGRDPAGALEDATRAIELQPAVFSWWSGRGILRQELGDHAGAIEDFTRAGELQPLDAEVWLGRALSQARLGRSDLALADLTRAVECDEGLAKAWMARGIHRSRRGDHGGAVADLTRALELDPTQPSAYGQRGLARLEAGDLEGARADAARALELGPDLPWSWEVTGRVRLVEGDLAGAIEAHGKAIALEPGLSQAWMNRGVARSKAGDPAGALADLDRAVELDPMRVEWLNARAAVLFEAGEVDRAVADLDRALELAPAYATGWSNRGHIRAERAMARGDVAELGAAIEDMSRALELDPRLSSAWHNRASARQAGGDVKGAVVDFSRALDIDPGNAGAWNGRGVAHFALGAWDEAIADLTRALELEPRRAQSWRNRGLCRIKNGDRAGAIADLERFLELVPATHPQVSEARRFLAELREGED